MDMGSSMTGDANGVVVAGVGVRPFGKLDGIPMSDMVENAVTSALQDAGVGYSDVDLAYYCHVLYQGVSAGQGMLSHFGSTGIPIVNLENACSSGTTGIWQAYCMIASGQAQDRKSTV